MLLNRLPTLNLSYAIGEIALIFVGVTAAFLFDAWRENQSEIAAELVILSEIDMDLEATKVDLESDITRLKERISNHIELTHGFEQPGLYSDA